MKLIQILPVIILLPLLGIKTSVSQVNYEMVVAQDGSGDYRTIQDAVDAAKAFPDKRITIFVKNGIYHEKVKIHSWNNKLSLIGEDVEKTIISSNDYFNKVGRGRNSTFFTYALLVEADDFYAENLTVENTAGPVGQAVALHVEGNRCVFKNCRLLGNQDTLYVAGENSRMYFSGCYIEGTTDFIFGAATVFFEQCTIHSKSDSYITAASTFPIQPFGFVFRKCRLTAEPGVAKVFLGRPWREFAKTVFLKCELGGHILPEGWHNWDKPGAEKTTFYAEFQNSGEGSNPGKRVAWSKQLAKKEAKKYTPQNVLGNWVNEWVTPQ